MSEFVTSGESLTKGFPPSLALSEDKMKMAKCAADILANMISDTNKAAIYTQIDALPEDLLDILAADFKVDWYDREGNIKDKRKTIRECIEVHRFKGTKYAIITALESFYNKVNVDEWFEYGGEPFHFKVTVCGSTIDEDKRSRILEKIRYYKNLRSVLDSVTFKVGIDAHTELKIGIKGRVGYKTIRSEVKGYGLE